MREGDGRAMRVETCGKPIMIIGPIDIVLGVFLARPFTLSAWSSRFTGSGHCLARRRSHGGGLPLAPQDFSVARYAMMFCRVSALGTLMTIFVP
jgi:hypothetical protein